MNQSAGDVEVVEFDAQTQYADTLSIEVRGPLTYVTNYNIETYIMSKMN